MFENYLLLLYGKNQKALFLEAVVDPLDVVSMILMKLEWEADFSAFFHWLVVGFLVATTDMKIRGIYKGVVLVVLTLLPITFPV